MASPIIVPEQLSYVREHQVLVCLVCHAGIRPGAAATRHLRNLHRWKGDQLKTALSWISTLSLQDPQTDALPPHGSRVIPELMPPFTGYCCIRCGFLTRSRHHIIAHLREQGHQEPDGESWRRVPIQTFSPGSHARYWMVAETQCAETEERSESEEGDDREERVEESFRGLLTQYQVEHDTKRAERRRIADNPSESENQSPWVKEMGWAEHFAGKDRKMIYLASVMPRAVKTRIADHRRQDETLGEVDAVLIRLGGSFDRVMERCAERLKLMPHETLRWLNSVDPMKPAGRPFTLKEHGSSMYRYRQFMKRCLVYCCRASQLGDEEAERQYGIQWTSAQWARLEDIHAVLTGRGPLDDDEDEETRAEQDAALDMAVFEYCIAIWRQQVAFSVYVNPLLHFAAVLGIHDVQGSWAEPKHYTSSLAGLVWCGRSLMLEDVFRDAPVDPREVTTDLVEIFREQQRLWLADGSHTPFSTMTRWMSYGKGFRRKEGGMAKVLWEGNAHTMRYLGQRIHVADFVTAAQAVVADAEAMMDELFTGSWETLRGTIDLGRIRDSLIYTGPDASFATDARNQWLRPGFAFLAERAQSTMWRDHKWRPKKVLAYLRTLRSFKRQLMVTLHIWGGQPGRGPEITKLKHCATAQVPGNVFVFDGQVMIITDLDKSRSIRGLGRKVARFVPTRVGQMLVAYIAWMIPFEEMLHDQAGVPGPPESLSSYMWKDARTGAWETDALSASMASLMGEHTGVELMVSDYRHIAILLARQIKGIMIRKVATEAGEQDDTDHEDGLTGETRDKTSWEFIWDSQATHGSVIAAGHYAVDVRFPNQLQPEKITAFREISRLWHRFLEARPASSSHEVKTSKRKAEIVPHESTPNTRVKRTRRG